jgi:hypothetical protein
MTTILRTIYKIHCIKHNEDVFLCYCYNREFAEYMVKVLSAQSWDSNVEFYLVEEVENNLLTLN